MRNKQSKKDLNKAIEISLSNEEVTKMVALFKERGYSLTHLDLLDELNERYSPQKIVLQLLKTTSNAIETSPFINQVEKDELELQFAALTHFTKLIKEVA
ncbi:MAG: hypothetical protein J5I47_13435 [Vicingus serpentipes]|nr:hypothetical protein [Vicingus serpentipes]